MEKGWRAAGLLKPLWERLPGRRDQLAELTGITPQTLSAYNSGSRNLGVVNAKRIAETLGVSLLELGAPLAEADGRGGDLVQRLEALEEEVARLREERDSALREVVVRLAGLEGSLAAAAPTTVRRSSRAPKR